MVFEAPYLSMLGHLSLFQAAEMQLLQIHDSILIECPKGQSEAIAAMLKETMEQICPKLGVRLQVDVASGENWGEV
jgi:DNA polymerase-1